MGLSIRNLNFVVRFIGFNLRPGELDMTNFESKENRPKADRIKKLSTRLQYLRIFHSKEIYEYRHYRY